MHNTTIDSNDEIAEDNNDPSFYETEEEKMKKAGSKEDDDENDADKEFFNKKDGESKIQGDGTFQKEKLLTAKNVGVNGKDENSQLTSTKTNVNEVKKTDEESRREDIPDSEQILDDLFNGNLH